MKDTSLEQRLNKMLKQINSISQTHRKRLITLARRADNVHEKLNVNVDSLQDAIDMLRIVVKYQCFDLEATRRENSTLKKLLEDYSQ